MFIEIIPESNQIIVDSNFTQRSEVADYLGAFLYVYSGRNLNIPRNLALFIRWWERKHGQVFAEEIVKNDEMIKYQWKKLIKPYLEETQKYLLLI